MSPTTSPTSSPTKLDSDGDGLPDSEEIDIYGTNHSIADTDGDGLNDGDEVENGTNPLQKEPTTSPTKVRRYAGHSTWAFNWCEC